MKLTRLAAAVLLCTGAGIVHADGIAYDYADVAYLNQNLGGGLSGNGFGLRGSIGFSDSFYGFAQYGDVNLGTAYDVSTNETRLGFGYHMPIKDQIDFVTEANWERTAIDTSFGNGNDSGWGLSVGVRGMVTDKLELDSKLRRIDYGSGAGGTDTLFGVGAVMQVSDRISVIAGYESGNTDTFSVGVRLHF